MTLYIEYANILHCVPKWRRKFLDDFSETSNVYDISNTYICYLLNVYAFADSKQMKYKILDNIL